MDTTTRQMIKELFPPVRRYLEANEGMNYLDLSKNLRAFPHLDPELKLRAKEAQIILAMDAASFTKQRTDGTLPPLDGIGCYTVRVVKELLAKKGSDNEADRENTT